MDNSKYDWLLCEKNKYLKNLNYGIGNKNSIKIILNKINNKLKLLAEKRYNEKRYNKNNIKVLEIDNKDVKNIII